MAVTVKPGKVDSLLPICRFLNFGVGRQSLFINYVDVIQPGAIHECFSWENAGNNVSYPSRTTKITRGIQHLRITCK